MDEEADTGEAPMFKVPALPPRATARQRQPETPSHGPGLSSTARDRLEEHRRQRAQREAQAGQQVVPLASSAEAPRGLGDFQRRSNKEDKYARYAEPSAPVDQSKQGRDSGWGARGRSKGWEEAPTPRTDRTERGGHGEGSARVPSRGWDETPRAGPGRTGEGSSRGNTWDATPRSVRGERRGTPDFTPNQHEWEEEQVKLDRDWYDQEVGVVRFLSLWLVLSSTRD